MFQHNLSYAYSSRAHMLCKPRYSFLCNWLARLRRWSSLEKAKVVEGAASDERTPKCPSNLRELLSSKGCGCVLSFAPLQQN